MNGVQAERLWLLARFLERLVPSERFDMRVICFDATSEDTPNVVDRPPCGSVCCAMGWTSAIPEFRRLGVRLWRFESDHLSIGLEADGVTLRVGWKRVAKALFGLDDHTANWLFSGAVCRPLLVQVEIMKNHVLDSTTVTAKDLDVATEDMFQEAERERISA